MKKNMKKISTGTLAAGRLSACVMTASAKEKAHITIKAADGVAPTELVIHKAGNDPRDSPFRTKLEDGKWETDVETDFIESFHITDWTQIIDSGTTSRYAYFLIEDGAKITITLYENEIIAESTGREPIAILQLNQFLEETQKQKSAGVTKELFEKDPALALEKMNQLNQEMKEVERDYYSKHPMISFLLDLETRISDPRFNDHTLYSDLEFYHANYEDKYPGHPAHKAIAEKENYGYQIYGGKYHDYDVRTVDGEKVRGYDYMKDGYNLIICWATWCGPCRKECQEIAEFIGKYQAAGLNVFALTREYESTDALKSVLEKDQYPFPTLVDLNNEFGVFDRHGTTSSGVFLVNPDRKIVFTGFGPDVLKNELKKYFPEVE